MEKLVVLDRQLILDPGATPGSSTILEDFACKLASEQKDLPPEFAKVINECFWDLF
jgi:hypothetical protein